MHTLIDSVTAPSKFCLRQSPDQIVRNYRQRMYSPLCGLIVEIGYSSHARKGPRVTIAGGELTGVHVLQNQAAPRPGSYHIGGGGILPFEASIKTFGETAERYAGSVAAIDPAQEFIFATHADMEKNGFDVLPPSKLELMDRRAPRADGFPFHPFTPELPITWVHAQNIGVGPTWRWIPAQLFLVGYPVRTHDGEPWLTAAVSTGTAVHTDYERALLASVYELIQIDSAMGHWFGCVKSVRIRFDERTRRLTQILDRHMPEGGYTTEFHLLPNPDLPGFTVACLVREPFERVPVVAVGLGADPSLERAMYKAWLEGIGVRSLAEWSLVNIFLEEGAQPHDRAQMLDLDSNVVFAAQPEGASAVNTRFRDCDELLASSLPPDTNLTTGEDARLAIRSFKDTGKELYVKDVTTRDVRSLGFRAMRLWSPDTLSLSLPSAPPDAHPRFSAYGELTHRNPHPYP